MDRCFSIVSSGDLVIKLIEVYYSCYWSEAATRLIELTLLFINSDAEFSTDKLTFNENNGLFISLREIFLWTHLFKSFGLTTVYDLNQVFCN